MQNILQQINPFNKVTLNPDYLSNFEAIFKSRNTKTTDTDSNIPIFPQNEDNYDFSNIGITQCSAVDDNFWNNIKGILKDILDGDSKDGGIGDTKQGATGDCWLLAGVNSLSYTQEGKKAISDALEYKNGYTIVHTACGDYVVSNQEVRLTKADPQYSDGDDDMIIFELAIEKIIDDYANGNIAINEEAGWLLKGALEEKPTSSGKSSTGGGWQAACLYFITGKMSEVTSDKNQMLEHLNDFKENNGKDLALSATIFTDKEGTVIKDVDGNELTLPSGHAYSIKKFDGENVTVINPWDSSKEINLPKDEFFKVFGHIQACDLSSLNPKQDFFSPKMYYNKDGNLDKSVDVDKNGNTISYQYKYDKKGKLTNVSCDAKYVDGRYANYKWDSQGNCTYAKNGNKDSNIALVRHYDDEGNVTEAMLGETDSNGNLKYTFSEMTTEIADKILDSDLLRFENLSAQDIFKLAKDLNDSQLNKAVDYLEHNPNATYAEVMENIK